MTRRVGILTGGGDCPGLNAAIRAVVKSLIVDHGIEVVGFRYGFRGLVEDDALPLSYDTVSNILTEGGTILGTNNKDNLFAIAQGGSQRVPPGEDRTQEARETFERHGLESLVCIGGDGTLTIARHLNENGIPIVGVPKTIDNDVMHSEKTIGFDTAVSIATECIDRLHTTAASHNRVIVVELMGRDAGWLALTAGVAGGGDVLLLPEIPFSWETIAAIVEGRAQKGRRFSLVITAEGAAKGPAVIDALVERTGLDCRAVILGHLQRGGTPTSADRILATQLGHAAAILTAKNETGRFVAWAKEGVETVPLTQITGQPRLVALDDPLVQAARSVGTSFGDKEP